MCVRARTYIRQLSACMSAGTPDYTSLYVDSYFVSFFVCVFYVVILSYFVEDVFMEGAIWYVKS